MQAVAAAMILSYAVIQHDKLWVRFDTAEWISLQGICELWILMSAYNMKIYANLKLH